MKLIGLHMVRIIFRVLCVNIACRQFSWHLWGRFEICVLLMIVISTCVKN